MSSKKKLVIDADIGIDDAQAINFLVASGEYDILGITLVAGNAQMDIISPNCQKLLAHIGAQHIPVYESGSYSLEGNYHESDGHYGTNAFAEIELPGCEPNVDKSMCSAQALVYYVKKYPGEVHLLCIGPLTNIAIAFFLDNNFPSLAGPIMIMGTDSNQKTLINVTDYAEFNTYCDPLALIVISKCFTKVKYPIIIVDFKLCTEFHFPYSPTSHLLDYKNNLKEHRKHFELYYLLSNKNNPHLTIDHRNNGHVCCDLEAAILFHDPSIVKKKRRVSIEVTLEGEKRGHVDFKDDPNGLFELITDIDRQKMFDKLLETIK